MTVGRGRRDMLTEDQALVLACLRGVPIEPPGLTSLQVAAGSGVDKTRVRQILGSLYVRRLVGRQKGLLGEASRYEYWTPEPPSEHEPEMPMRARPWRPARCPCGAALRRGQRGACELCEAKAHPWGDLTEKELMVMRLIDACGEHGLPFASVRELSPGCVKALQSLQRSGIAGVDLRHEVWRFGIKGRELCDSYLKSHPEVLTAR